MGKAWFGGKRRVAHGSAVVLRRGGVRFGSVGRGTAVEARRGLV